jgi:hypothetical protein
MKEHIRLKKKKLTELNKKLGLKSGTWKAGSQSIID